VYVPDQLTRYLTRQPISYAQQREVDEELGRAAAAISRPIRRIAARVQALAESRPALTFRKLAGAGPDRQADRYCR